MDICSDAGLVMMCLSPETETPNMKKLDINNQRQ